MVAKIFLVCLAVVALGLASELPTGLDPASEGVESSVSCYPITFYEFRFYAFFGFKTTFLIHRINRYPTLKICQVVKLIFYFIYLLLLLLHRIKTTD